MRYGLKLYLRSSKANGFKRLTRRAALVITLALILPIAASAYTIVLKDGRQIKIPDNFVVTETTLTYEVAQDITVTIQMATVNIPATERANNEPSGSLLQRAARQRVEMEEAGQRLAQTPARRTLTNSDLAAIRRARQESEARYEQRRRELGLPSQEEARGQDEEEARRAEERSQVAQDRQARDEAYWRARAEELRAQIAELDAQINYYYARMDEMGGYSFYSPYPFITSTAVSLPFGGFPVRAGRVAPPFAGVHPVGRRSVIANPPSIVGNVGGSSRIQPLANPSPFGARRGFGRPGFGRPIIGGPIVALGLSVFPTVFAQPGYDPFYYDRAAIFSQIRDLEAQRAGLRARWRILEDDARRAGAQPGWLRQ